MTVKIGVNSKLTFTGNIKGNEPSYSDTGDLTVTFLNGSILKGNIETVPSYFGANKVTFTSNSTVGSASSTNSSDDFVMIGDIISKGTGYGMNLDTNNGNHVTFEQGSMKRNIKATVDAYGRAGYNKFAFKQNNAKLEGNITTDVVKNEITFNWGEIIGNIEASGGDNAIYLTSTSAQSIIVGNIKAFGGSNTLTFGSVNEVQASLLDAGVSKIIGNITADGNRTATNALPLIPREAFKQLLLLEVVDMRALILLYLKVMPQLEVHHLKMH